MNFYNINNKSAKTKTNFPTKQNILIYFSIIIVFGLLIFNYQFAFANVFNFI